MPVGVVPDVITPGVTVGAGRYRLLERVGSDERVGAIFWRARDSVLDRDVALATLTGPGGRRSIQAALAAGRLEHPGVARILDVLGDPRQAGPGLTGLIVTEWIPGGDLATLATEATKDGRTAPTGMIARALEPLAGAVDAAHRAGFAIGCDHPQRIRVGNDGLARLAFPVASATGSTPDDMRGLGAVLYLLMTGRWPLSDPPAGLLAAPTGEDGVALSPRSLRPAASPTLAALTQRCLAGASTDGLYTGAAVRDLLEQIANAEADTMLLTRVPAVEPTENWQDGKAAPAAASPLPSDDRDLGRRQKLAIALVALGVALLVVFGWIATQVVSFFSDGTTAGGPTVVVTKPAVSSTAAASSGPASSQSAQQPPAAGPVRPTAVEVYDVTGDPDNPNRANRAIDGDPGSTWKTYDYNQAFPTLKPGVGLLLTLSESVTLAAVQIDSPSAGSIVEIRTPPSGDAGLAGTTVLGTAQLAPGRTEIKLNQPTAATRVLVWITGLTDRGGKHATELAEVNFVKAG